MRMRKRVLLRLQRLGRLRRRTNHACWRSSAVLTASGCRPVACWNSTRPPQTVSRARCSKKPGSRSAPSGSRACTRTCAWAWSAWRSKRDIEVDDGEVRFVEATRIHPAGGWNVDVAVMEFVREGPLEGELRRRIAAALRSVEGVETAEEMDTEVWFVTGTPAGEALVRAVAEVVDDLADQTRAYAQG